MIMHRYVRHVLSTMQRKDMEEIMKSHPRCFSLLELAIFIGKKGTHHLLQVGVLHMQVKGSGFTLSPQPWDHENVTWQVPKTMQLALKTDLTKRLSKTGLCCEGWISFQ